MSSFRRRRTAAARIEKQRSPEIWLGENQLQRRGHEKLLVPVRLVDSRGWYSETSLEERGWNAKRKTSHMVEVLRSVHGSLRAGNCKKKTLKKA